MGDDGWSDSPAGDPPPIVIPRHRMEKAYAIMRGRAKELGELNMLEIMTRLGWADNVWYSDKGTLQIGQLDDLQVCALAAAVMVYLEARGRK